jgi:hypothetical protein
MLEIYLIYLLYSSMALHPNNRWIASGQIAGKENKVNYNTVKPALVTTSI